MKRQFELSNVGQMEIFKTIEQDLEQNLLKCKYKLNKDTCMITLEGEEENLSDEVSIMQERIHELAPYIEIEEKEVLPTYRRVLILNGLDCANCAAKIERIAKRTLSHEVIVVDFATCRFIIETSDEELIQNLIERVTKITKQVDPNIVVSAKTSNSDLNPKKENSEKVDKVLFTCGAIVFAIALILHYLVFPHTVHNESYDIHDLTNLHLGVNVILVILYGIAYVLLGGDVLLGAVHNVKSGRVFDEKFLMSFATLMAFIIGSFTEAVSVMVFYKIGELFQEYAVNKSRKSISALMDIKPDSATMIVNDMEMVVDPAEIVVGDIIVIKPGERIPLDGIVMEGEASLDTSALTGETKYMEVGPRDRIISGSINMDGILKVKVTKVYQESMVAKILDMVSNASTKKAKAENFVSKFAKYYTPIVCALAAIIAAYFLIFTNRGIHDSIYPAMIFLVVSCPCALVISVPLAFFGAIGGAGKKGILIKGSNYLEALNNVGLVVFDKTGTLTKGHFKVVKIVGENLQEQEVLEYAAYCEVASHHPIAKSIVEEYGRDHIDFNKITYLPSPSKKGIIISLNEEELATGNASFMKEIGVEIPRIESTGLITYVAKNKTYVGHIILEDEIREDSRSTIQTLKQMGIKIAMITGDSDSIAQDVAKKLEIDTVFSEMSPIDKVKKVRKLKKTLGNKKLVFVGDGMNDAPVMSSADISIAMGALGSDAAIEVADIVLVLDELEKLPEVIGISKKTRRLVVENVVFALLIKVVVMLLSTFNVEHTYMWEAIFADVGVSLLAILNSIRAANLSKQGFTKIVQKENKKHAQG